MLDKSSSYVHFEASPSYQHVTSSDQSQIIPKTLITETQNISAIDYSMKFDKSSKKS